MTYDGHASGVAIAATSIALTIVSSVMVVSRVGTRVFIAHCFGIEDIFICLAFIFSISLCVVTAVMTLNGLGDSVSTLSDPDAWLPALYNSLWLYYLAMFCTKFSILIQYNRIFPRIEFRYVTYVLMSIIGVHTIWAFFSAIFTCVPVSKFWDSSVPGGGCLPIGPLWYANAGINIATGLAIGFLPLPIFHALDIPRKQKIGLGIVFGLGGFACLISILRLPSLHAALTSTDWPYDYGSTAIWNEAEVNVGIVCSCLPTLRALISKFWPGAFSTRELKDITSNANATRFLEIDSETTASKGSRSPSSTGMHSRQSSERLGHALANSEIVSHATYMRTYQNRLTRTEQDLVHVPVPTHIPPHSRVHVLTVVEDEERGGRVSISAPIMTTSTRMPDVVPRSYRPREHTPPGERTMFRSLSTADEIAAMERAVEQLGEASRGQSRDNLTEHSDNLTEHTDTVPPSYYYKQADELSRMEWAPNGQEHAVPQMHPGEQRDPEFIPPPGHEQQWVHPAEREPQFHHPAERDEHFVAKPPTMLHPVDRRISEVVDEL